VLHCTSLHEITAGEQLLNWGFAMDGKVRPVGELVRPLPALTASRKPARSAPASPAALPAVPLAAGAGVIIAIVLGVGWLGRRRRRSAALDRRPPVDVNRYTAADPADPDQHPPT
jgi:hypothetical protein